jgi:hypothetical protein
MVFFSSLLDDQPRLINGALMEPPFQRATTVQETQWACELTPLPEGDTRWVDFKEIRGTDVQEAAQKAPHQT